MRYHPVQHRLWTSPARFKVIPAGRRSGKTELAKRKGVIRAIGECTWPDSWFVFGAPTHQQAKRVYWSDLKALVPPELLLCKPSESDLMITLYNNAKILVTGLDVPERIEGIPLSWIGIDEYGNMRREVWAEHIRPALSDRIGEAWIYGVPQGRNHYYKLNERAKKDQSGEWQSFHWISADILSPNEIEAARRDLDLLTYQQEYEASFVYFEGKAYYIFTEGTHCDASLKYNSALPLVFCFDFNVSPGVCAICQEQTYAGKLPNIDAQCTAVIDEIWIPNNSNTIKVCERLLDRYGQHKEEVFCYGDATGGARGSAKVKGSDWDLIKQALRPIYQDRLHVRVADENPRERVRVNAMNSRLQTMDKKIHLLVNNTTCPHIVEDLDGVTLKDDGSGEIDKDDNSDLTHLTDGLGYYIEKKFPVRAGVQFIQSDLY